MFQFIYELPTAGVPYFNKSRFTYLLLFYACCACAENESLDFLSSNFWNKSIVV